MEDKDSESIESFATSTTEAPREVQRKSRPPKARRDYSPSDLLSRQEAAEYLGVAEQTLAVWKCTGRYDLPYVKIGKLVKYRKTDLDRFIEGMKHESLAWKKRDP
ncbi:MAG: helix-turn-helix domain-containing protein [Bacteroidetes bacterium]|nr:helix-turn-helix domain-containing protein [Bacteroidota bacterium]